MVGTCYGSEGFIHVVYVFPPGIITAGGTAARADDHVIFDYCAVHHDAAHADQNAIADGAAVQHDFVGDGHIIADQQREAVRVEWPGMSDVQHAAVLHTLSVLQQAALHKQPLTVRWACLLHDVGKGLTAVDKLPQHIAHEKTGLTLIKAVNERFKVPRDCQELALLVGQSPTPRR